MTHPIRILAETSDTVTIGRSDFEALIEAAEDAEDLAALAAPRRRGISSGRGSRAPRLSDRR